MNKLLSSLGVALVAATMSLLAGCSLYFGDSGSSSTPGSNNGNSNGNNGGSSSSGGNSSGGPPGFSCTADTNCAAGCFCANGVCTEGGFCSTDKDCGTTFHCDTNRSSCIPTSSIGGCQGDIVDTCNVKQPACAENQVALRKDGCFTGDCAAISACEAAPECKSIQHADDCQARSADCTMVVNGLNCSQNGDGTTPCQAGQANCSCESYPFVSCEDRTAGLGPTLVVGQ
jgi:hypothetical protein